MSDNTKPAGHYLAASFWRRMAAIFYDSFLLLAALFVATAIALPLNDGKAFSSDQYGFSVYLFLVCFSFFGWFWTHGGQTPGMKAWQIKLVANSRPNAAITWIQAFKRFLASILSWVIIGAGFFAILFSAKKLAWHDRLSGSSIVFYPKQTWNHSIWYSSVLQETLRFPSQFLNNFCNLHSQQPTVWVTSVSWYIYHWHGSIEMDV